MSRELTHRILATAGSMQGLETELDRLSLHSLPLHDDDQSPWLSTAERRSIADSPQSTGSVGQSRERRISQSSSKFDSAISSLHSQTDHTTDEEVSKSSKHSHKSKRRHREASFSQSDWDWLYHTQPKGSLPERQTSKKKHKAKRKHDSEHSIPSSTTSTPSHRTRQSTPRTPTLGFLHRGGSIQSLNSNDSYDSSGSSRRSSHVLSIGLSQEDILQIANLPSEKCTPKLKRTNSTVSDVVSPQEQHAEVVYIPPPPEQEYGNDSDSSTSTVVGEDLQPPSTEEQESSEVFSPSTADTLEATGGPLMPEIVVINAPDNESETHRVPVTRTPADKSTRSSPNPKLPRRYSRDAGDWLKPSTDFAKRANTPKRSASFLQRIKLRRGTSFKIESRPKKRVPVRRSFSDRMMYQIRKGLVDYKQDMNFISKPSHLRRIGRMIDKQAGRFHIVQLHRPPSGRYGIYITESAFRRGIFVSRFADASTAKFYSGLVAPGDEIVKIDKEKVKDKSVDYVYEKLAKMDSVVFTILPVNSRPDW